MVEFVFVNFIESFIDFRINCEVILNLLHKIDEKPKQLLTVFT